jgi:hypothetical protein
MCFLLDSPPSTPARYRWPVATLGASPQPLWWPFLPTKGPGVPVSTLIQASSPPPGGFSSLSPPCVTCFSSLGRTKCTSIISVSNFAILCCGRGTLPSRQNPGNPSVTHQACFTPALGEEARGEAGYPGACEVSCGIWWECLLPSSTELRLAKTHPETNNPRAFCSHPTGRGQCVCGGVWLGD